MNGHSNSLSYDHEGGNNHDPNHNEPPEHDNLFGEKIEFNIMANFSNLKYSICKTFCYRNKDRE